MSKSSWSKVTAVPMLTSVSSDEVGTDGRNRRHLGGPRNAARLTTEVSQLPLDTVLCVLELAREAGVPTLLDLDVPPSDAIAELGDEATLDRVLRTADVIKPAKSATAELVPEARTTTLPPDGVNLKAFERRLPRSSCVTRTRSTSRPSGALSSRAMASR